MSIRMRARDGTLGRTVFWTTDDIDASGALYTGPGPLTDIVVFKVDLNSGAAEPGFAPFPEQWNYLGLEADLDTPLFGLVSTDFDDIRAIRDSSIIGMSVRLSAPFDSGEVTVTVTIAGSPGTLTVTLTAGQTEAQVTQNPGIDAFSAGTAVGVNLETSSDFSIDGECNIEVWLDTSTVGAGVTAPVMLPEQWGKLALEPDLNEAMETLVSIEFPDIMPIRDNSVVGLMVRLSQAFDAGTATITVTIDGTPGTLAVVVNPGQTEVWLTQDSGIDAYTAGQPVGLQIETSSDWSASGPVDVEAWIDVASSVTGSGGGGGGGGGTPFLRVNPTLQNSSFTAVEGFVHLLGTPGKFGTASLPSAAAAGVDGVVAFKLVDDFQNWDIAPDGADTIDGEPNFGNPYPVGMYLVMMSDGASNWNIISTNRSLRILNNSANPGGGPPFYASMDFLSPLTVGDVGAGRVQVYVDSAALAAPQSHVTKTWWPGSGFSGPEIYDDFGTLVASLDTLRGTGKATDFTIICDDSITSPAVIPSGIYNMTRVTWSGSNRKRASSSDDPGVQVEVQEGVQFYDLGQTPNFGQLRKITNHLHVTFTGTTPPNVYTNAFASNVPGLLLELDRHSSIRCTGGGPFIDMTTVAFNTSYIRIDGGAFVNGSYEVLRVTGSFLVQIFVSGNPFDVNNTNALIGDDTIRGNGSATVLVTAMQNCTVSETQTNLAVPFQVIWTPRKAFVSSQNVGGGSVGLNGGGVDVISASSPTNMVILGTVASQRGYIFTVKNKYTSSATITVVPAGGDTIDGAATYPLAVNASVTLISDGGTNWEVI